MVVFDGVGPDREIGRLAVRYAPDADTVLERIALERRGSEAIQLVTSDQTIRMTSGQEVRKRGSEPFLAELTSPGAPRGRLEQGCRPARRRDARTARASASRRALSDEAGSPPIAAAGGGLC